MPAKTLRKCIGLYVSTFDFLKAYAVAYRAHTQIRCRLSGFFQGTNHVVAITVSDQTNSNGRFSYDPPVISSFRPVTTPISTSVRLTIDGTNFGDSGTAYLDGALLNCNPRSNTQLVCDIPNVEGFGYTVAVEAGLQRRNATGFFSYVAPQITSVSVSNGATAGGYSLSLSGSNLGLGVSSSNSYSTYLVNYCSALTAASNATRIGTWVNSDTFLSAGELSDNNANKGGLSLSFTLPITDSSVAYRIFVLYSAAANRSSRTPFTVNSASGPSVLTLNQRYRGAPLWVDLGSFTLGSTAGQRSLSVNNIGTDGVVVLSEVCVCRVMTVQSINSSNFHWFFLTVH